MIQYKSVPGPVGLTINRNEDYASAVKQYAAIIDREAVGGWEFECIRKIPVTKSAGCLASLLGHEDITLYVNMLVFSKDDTGGISLAEADSNDFAHAASQIDTATIAEKAMEGAAYSQGTTSDCDPHISFVASKSVSDSIGDTYTPNNKKKTAVIAGAAAALVLIIVLIANGNSRNKYHEPDHDYDDYVYSDYDDYDHPDYDDYDNYADVEDVEPVPQNLQQINVNCHENTAVLTLREYQDGGWTEVMSIDAQIGNNGIAYDKREGDKCTPAGTFNVLYYISTEPLNTDLDYIEIDDDDVWICDPESRYYNTKQDSNLSSADWDNSLNENLFNKFERGYSVACIMFDYNGDGLTAGDAYSNRGSDIFIDGVGPKGNISSGYGDIKISASDMYRLLSCLDSSKNPILIVE